MLKLLAPFLAVVASVSVPAGKSIVDIAASNANLTTFVKLVKDANLVDTFSGPGPFTVFAPTDEAIAQYAFPAVVQYLQNPANVKDLVDVLNFHVLLGKKLAKDFTNTEIVKTVEGQEDEIFVYPNPFKIVINMQARVITPDLTASNGVIHTIDTLLIPQSFFQKSMAEIVSGTADVTTLVSALKAANLFDTLKVVNPSCQGTLTLLAPTNAAFAKLDPATLKHLLDPANIKELVDILTYHLIPQSYSAYDFTRYSVTHIRSVEGKDVDVYVNTTSEAITFNHQSNVVMPNAYSCTGFMHTIDTVLIPPKSKATSLIEQVSK